MNSSSECCPQPETGSLHLKIQDAIMNGDAFEYLSWLTENVDVNAANEKGETLLSSACSKGHINVVLHLLSQENVHLNIESVHHPTPLIAASRNGHLECVKALMSSATKCQLNYNKEHQEKTAIMHAACKCHWEIVRTLLKKQKILSLSEVNYIFDKSLKAEQWDIVRDVIPLCSHTNIRYLEHLLIIYQNDKWEDMSAEKLFRLSEHHEADASKYVLKRMVAKKDWKVLEDSLRILWKDMKVDVDLAEAILKGNNDEALELLSGEEIDIATKCGGLMIAALGDTSKTVAEFLLNLDCVYPVTVVNNALIVSCLSSSVQFITVLLKKRDFSYKTLIRAYRVALNDDFRLLVNRALQKEMERIIPLPKEEDEELSDDEESVHFRGMRRVRPSGVDPELAFILKIEGGRLHISPLIGNNVHEATTGNNVHEATTGNNVHEATTGNKFHEATSKMELEAFEALLAELLRRSLYNQYDDDDDDDDDDDSTTDEDV